MHICVYRNSKDTKGVHVSLDSLLERIRSGAKGLDDKTRLANTLAEGNVNTYRDYKATQLPAVVFSARMDGKGRKLANAVEHTGLVVVDFDKVSDLGSVLADLHNDPQVFVAYVSPSNRGIKVVFRVDPIPAVNQHKQAYTQVVAHCEGVYPEADTGGSDINRYAFLSHDPLCIHNPNAIPIDVDLTEVKPETPKPIAYTGDVDVVALDYIDPDTLDYEQWLQVGFACKTAGVPCGVWDTWSRRGRRYEDAECTKRWAGFTGIGITWSTVVYLARKGGYQPPMYTMPLTPQKPIIETRIR